LKKPKSPPGDGRPRIVGRHFWTDKAGNLIERVLDLPDPFTISELHQAIDAATRGTMRQDRKTATRTVLADQVNPHRMLTEREAAELLTIHYMTLRKMNANGIGPPRIKISANRVAYRLADCLSHVNASAAKARGAKRAVKKKPASDESPE
jgi:hypothetical protein